MNNLVDDRSSGLTGHAGGFIRGDNADLYENDAAREAERLSKHNPVSGIDHLNSIIRENLQAQGVDKKQAAKTQVVEQVKTDIDLGRRSQLAEDHADFSTMIFNVNNIVYQHSSTAGEFSKPEEKLQAAIQKAFSAYEKEYEKIAAKALAKSALKK